MPANVCKLLLLQKEKLDLYETYLLEAAQLIKKYHWKVDNPDDMLKLDYLCEELDKVQEKIENLDAIKS